ncbi:MAG: peptide methionine sulfoxide reductase MsrA [Leptospiraceae bacterium]|nr:MAG: peptide methionine sulfoxide reductase MsrA [Leptospiraceae bacterium]
MNQKRELATLGGGCFWCLDAIYRNIPGIINVICGYAGGHKKNPTYQEVCTGNTGHAEVVQITYDPSIISYKEILEIFWKIHDPTTLNRQGADIGTQYRSIILYHDEKQKEIAQQSKLEHQKFFKNPIVTEIVPLKEFYPAEEYHQNFYNKNPNYPYCVYVIEPKLQKIKDFYK